jgi:hypothetical protein
MNKKNKRAIFGFSEIFRIFDRISEIRGILGQPSKTSNLFTKISDFFVSFCGKVFIKSFRFMTTA